MTVLQILNIVYQIYYEVKGSYVSKMLVHETVETFLFLFFIELSQLLSSLSSDLLVEKIGVPGENYRPVASHSQTLSHSVVLSTHRHDRGSNILLEKLPFSLFFLSSLLSEQP
jgi:hypothetical protein